MRCTLLIAVAFALPFSASAADRSVSGGLMAGACALFREGGAGFLLTTPTYWLRGTIMEIRRERRPTAVCPAIKRALGDYTREDHRRIAAATPCVSDPARVREVDVVKIRLAVDAWETPWTYQHGTPGWLFRGHFLDTELRQGAIIEMDASWLEGCDSRP